MEHQHTKQMKVKLLWVTSSEGGPSLVHVPPSLPTPLCLSALSTGIGQNPMVGEETLRPWFLSFEVCGFSSAGPPFCMNKMRDYV